MAEDYGSDYLSIVSDDGTEYELEILSRVEYNGAEYLAVIPAEESDQGDYSVSILKSTEEDGEPILSIIEDEGELQAVNDLIMESLYEESDE